MPRRPQYIADRHVGEKLRQLRVIANRSQSELGEHIGVTFQQVQKYEQGRNRISAGRLFDIAHTLNVPISFFFEGLDLSPSLTPGDERDTRARLSADAIRIAKLFEGISSKRLRSRVLQLVRDLADESDVARQADDIE